VVPVVDKCAAAWQGSLWPSLEIQLTGDNAMKKKKNILHRQSDLLPGSSSHFEPARVVILDPTKLAMGHNKCHMYFTFLKRMKTSSDGNCLFVVLFTMWSCRTMAWLIQNMACVSLRSNSSNRSNNSSAKQSGTHN